jgi:hypothetical protein
VLYVKAEAVIKYLLTENDSEENVYKRPKAIYEEDRWRWTQALFAVRLGKLSLCFAKHNTT